MEESWLKEKIIRLSNTNWLYRLACLSFCKLKDKLTFEEFYIFLQRLNEKQLGVDNSKKFALQKIIEIYEFQNGKPPF